MTDIQVGDVCLDLAQGRPVHVLAETGLDVETWSDRNGYDLLENYGNGRLQTQPDDAVFDLVYCSGAKSEPSKTYAFPESRLLRVETEKADDGRQVYDRAVVDVLDALFQAFDDRGIKETLEFAAVDRFDDDLVDEAKELADVEQTIGTDE
jgi:hypothetical protein